MDLVIRDCVVSVCGKCDACTFHVRWCGRGLIIMVLWFSIPICCLSSVCSSANSLNSKRCTLFVELEGWGLPRLDGFKMQFGD